MRSWAWWRDGMTVARATRGALLSLPLLLPLAPAAGQRPADEARLTIGAGLSFATGGGALWQVGNQPIFNAGVADTLALSRRLTSGFGVSFSGAYFPSRFYGFSAEIALQRLGMSDGCLLRSPNPSAYTQDICGSVNNRESNTGTSVIMGGVVLRPGFRGAIQPYGRVMAGFLVLQQSVAALEGRVRRPPGNLIAAALVYRDEDVTSTSPYLALGAGFAASLGPGWQMRCELRDSWSSLPAVTGPTSRQGVEPEVGRRGHHQISFAVSIDVVLERKRGRRY